MMKVTYSPAFKREYKAWQKKNKNKDELLIKAINLFLENPFHSLLHA